MEEQFSSQAMQPHTHTHTDRQTDREREREREIYSSEDAISTPANYVHLRLILPDDARLVMRLPSIFRVRFGSRIEDSQSLTSAKYGDRILRRPIRLLRWLPLAGSVM